MEEHAEVIFATAACSKLYRTDQMLFGCSGFPYLDEAEPTPPGALESLGMEGVR